MYSCMDTLHKMVYVGNSFGRLEYVFFADMTKYTNKHTQKQSYES